jgi:RHS repeat-associated protein
VTPLFTGKERDAETGLDYFGARHLSSAQGRFTSPDLPLLAQETSDPQSWNLYSYTANNPLIRIDPDGRNWFQINGNWEWHEGDTYTYTDKKKKEHTVHSNYTHLLVFQQTGTNRYGAATGTLTLYDQNKAVAQSSVFSGGRNSPAQSDPIPEGTFYINSARKETATSPGAVRPIDGGALLHNFWGIEKIPPALSDAAGNSYNFQVEWGSIRAALNEPRQGMPQAYRGNFLHGKTRPGDYTHGCICERSERILKILWTLPTPRIPVWVRGK